MSKRPAPAHITPATPDAAPDTGTPGKGKAKTARNKGLRFPELHAALGEVVRIRRKERFLSQSDLSLDADLDRAYISRIERAEQSPTISTLIAVASRLGVPAWQILKEAEERAKEKNA